MRRPSIPFPVALQYLGDPNYSLYMFGNLASSIGIWTQRVAIGWATWELTHSAGWLGVIALAEAGPTMFLGIIAGSVLDRVNQLHALRISQSMSVVYAFTIAACSWFGVLSIWLLVSLVAIRGVIFVFNRIGRQTILYEIVKDKNLASAIALNSTIQVTSRFIGPAIGGAVLASGGTSWALITAAGLFCIFTVSLANLKIVVPAKPSAATTSFLGELRDGLTYVMAHQGMRIQFAILVLVSLLASPLSDLFPGISARIFDRGSSGLAILLACHGLGAMLAGLWLSIRAGIAGLTRISLISIPVMGLAMMVLVTDGVFALTCAMSFIAGLAYVAQSITNQTLIQSAVDRAYRGRVMGFYSMIAQGMPSLGTLAIGVVSDRIGLPIPIVCAGAGCIVLWLIVWRQRGYMARNLEHGPALP